MGQDFEREPRTQSQGRHGVANSQSSVRSAASRGEDEVGVITETVKRILATQNLGAAGDSSDIAPLQRTTNSFLKYLTDAMLEVNKDLIRELQRDLMDKVNEYIERSANVNRARHHASRNDNVRVGQQPASDNESLFD